MANMASLFNYALDSSRERHLHTEIDGFTIFIRDDVAIVICPRQQRVLNDIKPRHPVKSMDSDGT